MINCSALQCNLHCNRTWWYAEQCTLCDRCAPFPPLLTCEQTCDKISQSIQLHHTHAPFLLQPGTLIFLFLSRWVFALLIFTGCGQSNRTRNKGWSVVAWCRLVINWRQKGLGRDKASLASIAQTRVTRHQTIHIGERFPETQQDNCWSIDG